jgi:hypothetical protein
MMLSGSWIAELNGMSDMKMENGIRYESANDFFDLRGNMLMRLTSKAAIEVCERSSKLGLIVSRIEGGIWHDPIFEARIDCIWDGIDYPEKMDAVEMNNKKAIEFIQEESEVHDVFILTTFGMNEVDDEPKIKILLW